MFTPPEKDILILLGTDTQVTHEKPRGIQLRRRAPKEDNTVVCNWMLGITSHNDPRALEIPDARRLDETKRLLLEAAERCVSPPIIEPPKDSAEEPILRVFKLYTGSFRLCAISQDGKYGFYYVVKPNGPDFAHNLFTCPRMNDVVFHFRARKQNNIRTINMFITNSDFEEIFPPKVVD